MTHLKSCKSFMDYSQPCYYSTRLLEKLKSLDHKAVLDFDLINKAIYWAKKYHDGQFRKSGEPFYSHPLEVAYMVVDYNLTTNVTVASILHDIVEDTEVTIGMIVDGFNRRIAEIVDRLTRDRPDGYKFSVEEILNNAYEKNDKEVLLIKIVDRLHNMQTVQAKSHEKMKKTIKETLVNFLALSEIMELPILSDALYNLCHQTNVVLGVVPKQNFVLDKLFILDKTVPVSENNVR